jgi:hypothetical protein
MDPIHTLMLEAVHCFEKMLSLLCKQEFHVAPYLSQDSIAIVATVAQEDRTNLRKRGDVVALENLASSMGQQSGIATVSIQVEV